MEHLIKMWTRMFQEGLLKLKGVKIIQQAILETLVLTYKTLSR